MCLNLLDVSGLQIGQQLSGCTLVQYAGSLTGQDFDIITQISPYVFYNLVPWVICWTPHWFNKPKIYFILHLPAHIQYFRPAILLATEPFESYNAIIWGKIRPIISSVADTISSVRAISLGSIYRLLAQQDHLSAQTCVMRYLCSQQAGSTTI
ncbi:hypothetical protein V8E53_013400 [Lactarius tabidus]